MGRNHIALALPRYIPLVIRLTALARSSRRIHADTTVCTAGIRKPCDTPNTNLQKTNRNVRRASPGVINEASDHDKKHTVSTTSPPYRCAAIPPGTCDTPYPQ